MVSEPAAGGHSSASASADKGSRPDTATNSSRGSPPLPTGVEDFHTLASERQPIDALRQLAALRGQLADWEHSAVLAALEGDHSWDEIVEALGITGDDARRRFTEHGESEEAAEIWSDPEAGLADALSVAGHELAQPLTVALACSKLLTRPSLNTDAKLRQEVLEGLARSLTQLQSLIDDFEVMGDPEVLYHSDEDPMARRREPQAMRWVLQKAVEDFALAHEHSAVELNCTGDLPVMVDLARFRQVISNLLSNAEKFGTPGQAIHVDARAQGPSVIVSVHNEGRGFASEEADRIFEKSIRLDGKIRGRGWGLFVAKAIVSAHGGQLWAESEPDKGATFLIRIPALQS